MSPKALEAAWKQAISESGPLRAVTKRRTEPGPNGMTIVDLASAFERGRLTVRVVLDRDSRVAGLWFRPADAS